MMANIGEFAVAQIVQVIHNAPDAGTAVDTNVLDALTGRAQIIKDRGNLRLRHLIQEGRLHFRGDYRQSRHAPADHHPDAGQKLLRTVACIDGGHLVAVCVGERLRRSVHIEKERILHV